MAGPDLPRPLGSTLRPMPGPAAHRAWADPVIRREIMLFTTTVALHPMILDTDLDQTERGTLAVMMRLCTETLYEAIAIMYHTVEEKVIEMLLRRCKDPDRYLAYVQAVRCVTVSVNAFKDACKIVPIVTRYPRLNRIRSYVSGSDLPNARRYDLRLARDRGGAVQAATVEIPLDISPYEDVLSLATDATGDTQAVRHQAPRCHAIPSTWDVRTTYSLYLDLTGPKDGDECVMMAQTILNAIHIDSAQISTEMVSGAWLGSDQQKIIKGLRLEHCTALGLELGTHAGELKDMSPPFQNTKSRLSLTFYGNSLPYLKPGEQANRVPELSVESAVFMIDPATIGPFDVVTLDLTTLHGADARPTTTLVTSRARAT